MIIHGRLRAMALRAAGGLPIKSQAASEKNRPRLVRGFLFLSTLDEDNRIVLIVRKIEREPGVQRGSGRCTQSTVIGGRYEPQNVG